MQIITRQTLAALSDAAQASPRRRSNLNMHAQLDDPVQRMLNSGHPGSYVRPHRHGPDRWESFVLVQGSIAILTFDDDGRAINRYDLHPNDLPIVELPGGVWHSITFLEPGSVVFELKPGPYRPTSDKDFAAWAPLENAPGADALAAWLAIAQPGERWSGYSAE